MTSGSIRSTCPYCGVGCGVRVTPTDDGAHTVVGATEHPANAGRLCAKGSALAATLDVSDRLTAPRIGSRDTDWDEALDLVARHFRAVIDEHGPDAVALYVSGQLLTEDYYVANKFVKGWLGNANIDTNSRLCMASSVAGHKRAFGTDTVPGQYDDLERADVVVLVGSHLAWCHPVLHQRLMATREARTDMTIVAIDPRATATTEMADLHLPLAPDTDIDLFGGLLAELVRRDAIDRDWIDAHVEGADAAFASVASLSVAETARRTTLREADVARFFELFARTERVVTVYGQGVNQSARGTDTVNAIIDAHLATGRIGRPGMGPFSITGQPNAMGGREVGGLANMLAAHVDLDDAAGRDRVQRFWNSPRIADAPGPKAVELFDRIADGRIRAVWIMATNPVDSLPDANRVRDALRDCPFVVVSDVVADTDTARLADVLLPSAAWSEKDGTVTNSERCVSRQRGFRAPPGDARPDWWQLAQVARRLGWGEAFAWNGPAEIFREHATLSRAAGSPDFDIGAAAALDDRAYDAMESFVWPWRVGEAPRAHRFFADGRFHTPSGRARMLPIAPSAVDVDPGTMTLNTGRTRDQWHTMTRTGPVAALTAHVGEPFAEIAPVDAERHGIAAADIVEVASAHGHVRVRALVTDRQRPGSVFVPMHWSDAFASNARVDALVPPVLDPVSGQPASKSARVSLTRWPANACAYLLLPRRPERLPRRQTTYWALAATPSGWQLELASRDGVDALERLCARLLHDTLPDRPDLERLDQADSTGSARRQIVYDGARPVAASFVATGPVDVARRWLIDRFGDAAADVPRHDLLAGRPASDRPDCGAIVCSCLGVGATTIRLAIRQGRCTDVATIGTALRAGTNCGACRPELAALLRAERERDVEPVVG